MATTGTSFSGIASGIQTEALINAILKQEGLPVDRLKARQTANNQRTASLQSMRTAMNTLATSLASLSGTSFSARTVSSSDSNGTYVSATASGAEAGNYEVLVNQLATRSRLVVSGGAASATSSILKDGETQATFALQGTDGTVESFTLDSSQANLNGLRDAINSRSSTVTASVVNTGDGSGTPYKLVLTAKETGISTATNSTNGYIRIAEVGAGLEVTNLGIARVADTSAIASGTASVQAKNAIFSLNGVTMSRQSNVVTDAVEGLTLTLKSGGQDLATGTATTLTVAQDKTAATAAMQDVVTKFNSLLKIYKDASSRTGPLANDSTARSIMNQVREALTGQPAGIDSGATYKRPSDIGISTGKDGTLSLDVSAFQKAMDTDPVAAKAVIAPSGTSSNGGVVSFAGSTLKSPGGEISFSVSSTGGSGFQADFTIGGQTVSMFGTVGDTIVGTSGSAIEGLSFKVAANSGSGTIQVNRGVAYTVQGLINDLTAAGSGNLATTLTSIEQQNKSLADQIIAGQSRLDRRRISLTAEFARLESTISKLQSAGSTLGGVR